MSSPVDANMCFCVIFHAIGSSQPVSTRSKGADLTGPKFHTANTKTVLVLTFFVLCVLFKAQSCSRRVQSCDGFGR